MKIALLIVLLAAAVTPFIWSVRAGGGWISSSVQNDDVTWDLAGWAVRQITVNVDSQAGDARQLSLTMLGPIGRVVEPWTSIHADLDGLELRGIDGGRFRVPLGHATTFFDSSAETWVSSDLRFDPLDLSPRATDRSVAERMKEKYPQRADFIGRAFGEEGPR